MVKEEMASFANDSQSFLNLLKIDALSNTRLPLMAVAWEPCDSCLGFSGSQSKCNDFQMDEDGDALWMNIC